MAIDYASANLAMDEACDLEERWLKEHADELCGTCKLFDECPCGCEWGICRDCNELVWGKENVRYYEHICWEER